MRLAGSHSKRKVPPPYARAEDFARVRFTVVGMTWRWV